MMRTAGAVILGYAVWTAVWLGGNGLLFAEAGRVVGAGEPYTAPGPLAGVVILSVACSLVAGAATAVVARSRARVALVVVGALLLATGIAVQAGVWKLMPVWYHVTFLVLVVPVVLVGGRLAGSRA